MSFPLEIPEPLRRALPPGTGVLLGISGGVDSALALAVLQELGCDVQCVTFKNFCYSEDDIQPDEQSCCSLDAIEDARRLARKFGAVHWVHGVEESFRKKVIDPFIQDYSSAITPNPCLACNADVRFPEFVRLATRQGCQFAATGHYARIDHNGEAPALLKGLDPAKDQSYFLHRVPADLFGNLVFPLGWWPKTEVRRAASELGLEVAKKRDSQEICFVPDGDRAFLFSNVKGTQSGDIVDRSGKVLGQHKGLIHYTVGQRRGLGIAAAEPLYVLSLDLENSRLVVGQKNQLATYGVLARDFVTAVPDFPDEGPRDGYPVTARLRHRHGGCLVSSWQLNRNEGLLEVELAEPVDGAAPGQGLVLYQDDLVLGGACIAGSFDPGVKSK
ncbi:MAG: tRNA 2-thiouridine(34) synthase MnmA [bacterium]|nr:tRNA 2-thiouridine(34) synthase MnmA [bacterium]